MFRARHHLAHSVGQDDRDIDQSASVTVVRPPSVDDEPTRMLVVDGSTETLHRLLLAIEGGDRGALVALEGHIGGLVRANIRRVLCDASRTDAVTRAFFAEVSRGVKDFDPDQDCAQAWLLTRAHQRAMMGLGSGHAAGS